MSLSKNVMELATAWPVLAGIAGLLAVGSGMVFQMRSLTNEVQRLQSKIESIPERLTTLESNRVPMRREIEAMWSDIKDHEARLRDLERKREPR